MQYYVNYEINNAAHVVSIEFTGFFSLYQSPQSIDRIAVAIYITKRNAVALMFSYNLSGLSGVIISIPL